MREDGGIPEKILVHMSVAAYVVSIEPLPCFHCAFKLFVLLRTIDDSKTRSSENYSHKIWIISGQKWSKPVLGISKRCQHFYDPPEINRKLNTNEYQGLHNSSIPNKYSSPTKWLIRRHLLKEIFSIKNIWFPSGTRKTIIVKFSCVNSFYVAWTGCSG